jgi:hypothetical protein
MEWLTKNFSQHAASSQQAAQEDPSSDYSCHWSQLFNIVTGFVR